MTELQPILDLLAGKYSWVSTAITWVGAVMTVFRLVFKPFSARIVDRLTAMMAEAATSLDEEDDVFWGLILRNHAYRAVAFTVDLLFSVRLPNYACFLREKERVKYEK